MDIVEAGVVSWEDLIRCVQTFHYGRNANRSDFSLVWYERKGSCSSKHAFLKMMADLNAIPNVDLVLCMYKMSATNTAKVGAVLEQYKLDYLPEAHCYLRFNGQALDVTTMTSNVSTIQADVLEEQNILPNQVIQFKVDYHQTYLKNWAIANHPETSFEELWAIREQCIKALEC